MGQPGGGSPGDGGEPGGGGTGGAAGTGGTGGIGGTGGTGGIGGTGGTGGTGATDGFHLPGYAAPEAHGYDMQLQENDCRNCHAADLTGSLGPSCDTCHAPGWRTDCVFCHGGIDNGFGSPPRDLAGVITNISFPGHTPHVTVGIASGFDCVQCHVKAVDVLSPGHAFDDTKGMAEVDFGGGLSWQGTYTSGVGCQSLYCHGNGQGDNGVVATDAQPMRCDSCHAGSLSGADDDWRTMSGEHRKHLKEDPDCGNCHWDVTEDGLSISGPLLHVDGFPQASFPDDIQISYNPATGRCSGDCHGKKHEDKRW